MKWISTKYALPQPETTVIIFHNGKVSPGQCWLTTKNYGTAGLVMWESDVEALGKDAVEWWRPLPDPPEVEK